VVETLFYAEDYSLGVGGVEREVVVQELEGAGVWGLVELTTVSKVLPFSRAVFMTLHALSYVVGGDLAVRPRRRY
jgi:hypothetical protein